jgi:hypothetical protein
MKQIALTLLAALLVLSAAGTLYITEAAVLLKKTKVYDESADKVVEAVIAQDKYPLMAPYDILNKRSRYVSESCVI